MSPRRPDNMSQGSQVSGIAPQLSVCHEGNDFRQTDRQTDQPTDNCIAPQMILTKEIFCPSTSRRKSLKPFQISFALSPLNLLCL